MPPKIRRPAAAVKEEDEKSEEVRASDVTLAQCRNLKDIEVLKGSYWESQVKAAVRVKEVTIRSGELFLRCQVLGTQNEGLLRAATAREGRMIEAHLCPEGCTGGPHKEGVMHIALFRHLGEEREAWMKNMIPEEKRGEAVEAGPDELQELREDMLRVAGPLKEGDRDQMGGEPPGSASEEKRKKRKKRSKSRQRGRKEWKVEGQKDLKALFQNTGVDPDPSVRKRFRRKAARLARKKNRESKSSGTSSTSSTEDQTAGDATLFGSSSKVQVIGKRLPGALAAAALDEAAESLITAEGGLWELREGPLPALFVRYFRAQLGGKMPPPMARETLTLCHSMDCLLRGRPAEALDVLGQRVKALELQSSGIHYTVSQQQELLPRDSSSISTTPELYEAARRAREEGRVRAEASRPYGGRSAGAQKGEEWSKGWNRKGQGKGKGQKGETRKTEGEKNDKGKPKGS
eukprot:s2053_g14.t1